MSELFNTIMPETDDRTLCVQIEKPITAKGYDQNFLPRVEKIIAQHKELRLLIYYKNFKGWEREAAIEDMASLAKYYTKMKKTALVNAPDSEVFKNTVRQRAVAGEIRFFSTAELQDAIAWVKA